MNINAAHLILDAQQLRIERIRIYPEASMTAAPTPPPLTGPSGVGGHEVAEIADRLVEAGCHAYEVRACGATIVGRGAARVLVAWNDGTWIVTANGLLVCVLSTWADIAELPARIAAATAPNPSTPLAA